MMEEPGATELPTSIRHGRTNGARWQFFAPLVVISLIVVGLGAVYWSRYTSAPALPPQRDLAQEARADLEALDVQRKEGGTQKCPGCRQC